MKQLQDYYVSGEDLGTSNLLRRSVKIKEILQEIIFLLKSCYFDIPPHSAMVSSPPLHLVLKQKLSPGEKVREVVRPFGKIVF